MTTTNSINWFLTAGTLRAAFTRDKRDDGSTFWTYTDQARQSADDLATWIGELHNDELPNDWRYETIVGICEALCETEEYQNLKDLDEYDDLVDVIAGNECDIYTGDLLKWYGDNPNRLSYIEDAESEGYLPDKCDMFTRLAMGQHVCVSQMANKIIERLRQGK